MWIMEILVIKKERKIIKKGNLKFFKVKESELVDSFY